MINRKNSLARRYSGALLLLTVASLLIACGGAESASSSSTTATASNTATLAWDALPLADISGYRVYYGTTRGPCARHPGDSQKTLNVIEKPACPRGKWIC